MNPAFYYLLKEGPIVRVADSLFDYPMLENYTQSFITIRTPQARCSLFGRGICQLDDCFKNFLFHSVKIDIFITGRNFFKPIHEALTRCKSMTNDFSKGL